MASFIRRAQSFNPDVGEAVRELHAGITQPDSELVLFFCSSTYDRDALEAEVGRRFAGCRVVGCTAAGEIGPAGYLDHSLVGVSFSSRGFHAAISRMSGLQDFDPSQGQAFAKQLRAQFNARGGTDASRSFGFLMIDGMSMREEQVTRTLQGTLGTIPLLGGSAGDDLRLDSTWVFHEGKFHRDAAVLVLLQSALPFRIFQTQHFVSRQERMVVTRAVPSERIVCEINGRPAAYEYARLTGAPEDALDALHFSTWTMVVRIGGVDHVRSIQKALPGGALKFYGAVEEGLVFRIAHGDALEENLAQTFARLRLELGELELVLACDCILRRLEIERTRRKAALARLMADGNVVGFNTYGEQFRGVHVNQTLVGVAFGAAREESHG